MQPTPEVAALLELFVRSGSPPLHELGVQGAREATEASARSLQGRPPVAVGRVEELTVPAQADGSVLPIRVYHPGAGPDGTPEGSPGGPLLVYVHGGGWVTGDLDVVDGPCRRLAVGTGCTVASVGYRRSPEHRFPTPLDDVLAAVRWLAGRAGPGWPGGPADGSPYLVGDSAGANLALACALRLRDQGGPGLAGLALLYPPLGPPADLPGAGVGDPVLSAATMRWFWEQYAPPDGDPSAYPLLAASLAGLPPTLVVTAGLDVLREEGLAFAARLVEEGVPTTAVDYPGTTHGFFWMDRLLPQAHRVVQDVRDHLRARR